MNAVHLQSPLGQSGSVDGWMDDWTGEERGIGRWNRPNKWIWAGKSNHSRIRTWGSLPAPLPARLLLARGIIATWLAERNWIIFDFIWELLSPKWTQVPLRANDNLLLRLSLLRNLSITHWPFLHIPVDCHHRHHHYYYVDWSWPRRWCPWIAIMAPSVFGQNQHPSGSSSPFHCPFLSSCPEYVQTKQRQEDPLRTVA